MTATRRPRKASRLRATGLWMTWMVLGAMAVTPAPAQTKLAPTKRPAAAPIHKQVLTRLLPKVHAGAVRIRTGGKTSTYHRTTQARPAEFVVQGPVRLEVGARAMLPQTGGTPIHLRLELDGKLQKILRVKGIASTKAALAEGTGRIGARYKSVLQIPAGPHRLRVVPVEAAAIAALRVTKGSPPHGGKAKWVRFEPQAYERPILLRSGDREETWYRFTAQKPAELNVRGPLSLKISCRLDFDQHAGPSQTYVV